MKNANGSKSSLCNLPSQPFLYRKDLVTVWPTWLCKGKRNLGKVSWRYLYLHFICLWVSCSLNVCCCQMAMQTTPIPTSDPDFLFTFNSVTALTFLVSPGMNYQNPHRGFFFLPVYLRQKSLICTLPSVPSGWKAMDTVELLFLWIPFHLGLRKSRVLR